MRALVEKTFRDKYTKQIHRKGSVIDVTEERFEEINSAALGVFVAAVAAAAPVPEKPKGRKNHGKGS